MNEIRHCPLHPPPSPLPSLAVAIKSLTLADLEAVKATSAGNVTGIILKSQHRDLKRFCFFVVVQR